MNLFHVTSSAKLSFFVILICNSATSQIRLADDLQREITLPANANRIISLAPSITETLFAIGAAEQIAGVTDYCTVPFEAQSKRKVGGMTNPSIETIVSLKPDLIVMSMEGNSKLTFENLLRLNVPIFISNPKTLSDIYTSIEKLGVLTGKSVAADSAVQKMKLRADSLRSAATNLKKKSVMVFVSLQPIIVVGKGTFIDQLIEHAGGTNAAAKARGSYPQYSREAVLKGNPDVLIFTSDIARDPSEAMPLYPEWHKLRAVQHRRVFSINADLVSRPGPRAVNALEQLLQLIHKKN